MTVKEFNLPDLGEGLTEGEILKWLVNVGDTIELNQPIVEVETAKAAVEIPAKWAGKVATIFHPEGTMVEVGAPIIAIDTDPSGSATLTPPAVAPSAASLAAVDIAGDAPVEPGMIGGPAPGGRTAVLVGYGPKTAAAKRRPRTTTNATAALVQTEPPAPPVAPAAITVESSAATRPAPGSVLAKPPVRKLARDLGVDLVGIAGTGPNGSITRDDVLSVSSTSAPAEAAAPAAVRVGREERISVKGVRKLTAENMVASAFTAPHVTEFLTVDVTRSMKALERLKGKRDWRDVRVSPLLMVAKAALVALKRYPMVNSSWHSSGDAPAEIVVKHYVNLGIAAATERGLIVPNVKDADALTTRELADALNALVATAREGKTSPAAMSGGTFTITSVGPFGIDTGTPILPPGESAILVFGAIRDTPWVHKDKIKIRQVTTLGLSFDHRIIDGELGSKFLRDVGAFLEDPEGSLLAWS
ncbi:dihydrolipoamide acetyltransferase family protein [Dactylosporangium sp. NPDC049525]|uniref:dihydrolipoamide acetyltransferase family protein n=1 Tax=Dactylosporangium sp. NPDC049525 TaxID=3154730 RepID=UPI003436D5EF